MHYEEQHTQNLITRLVNISDFIQLTTLVGWMILLGLLFSGFVALIEIDLWWAGGLVEQFGKRPVSELIHNAETSFNQQEISELVAL